MTDQKLDQIADRVFSEIGSIDDRTTSEELEEIKAIIRAALDEVVKACGKDGERYRVLRVGINLPQYGGGIGNRLAVEALDAAVDAAREADPND